MAALERLQLENESLRQSLHKLQNSTTNHTSWVGLVGTLLSGPAQAWFAPLMETSSPLLDNFPAFLAELEATFGEADRRRTVQCDNRLL